MSRYCPECKMLTYDESKCDRCGYEFPDKKETKYQNTYKKPKIINKKKKENFLIKSLKKIIKDVLKEEIDTQQTTEETKPIQKKKLTHKLTQTEQILNIQQIAEHFNTTPSKITSTLIELKYIEKSGTWWIVTDLGKTQGGIQKYNAKTKKKYTLWETDILKNPNLRSALAKPQTKTTYKEKIEKGKAYEEYIANHYREKGYHVEEYGKRMGRKDHGIDLIAKKGKEIILIQCKNWKEKGKWKINHEKIKAFQTDARTFVEENPIFRSYQLTARYILSGDFMHPSAIKHIETMQKNGKSIDYEIIRM